MFGNRLNAFESSLNALAYFRVPFSSGRSEICDERAAGRRMRGVSHHFPPSFILLVLDFPPRVPLPPRAFPTQDRLFEEPTVKFHSCG